MRMRGSSLIFLSVLVFVFIIQGFCQKAEASMVEELSLSRLANHSDLIAFGKIISTKPRWNEERTRIETQCELQVEECLKGACGESLVFVRRGGDVDGIRQTVVGEASVENGEEVVVFLENVGGKLKFLGLSQGKFEVENVSGQRIVRHSSNNIEFNSQSAQRSAAMIYTLPLEIFLDLTKSLIMKSPLTVVSP